VFIFNEISFFFLIGSEQVLHELDEKRRVILDEKLVGVVSPTNSSWNK